MAETLKTISKSSFWNLGSKCSEPGATVSSTALDSGTSAVDVEKSASASD